MRWTVEWKTVVLGGVIITSAGCASVQKDAGFGDVRRLAGDRTGQTVRWNQGSSQDDEVASAVRVLLAKELTADEAVQIALLNNRSLQATYEELGIAQADLVQAGLLTNPIFSISARWTDGGPGGTNLELGITQQFVDLFALPLRKKIAAARFEQTKLRVAGEVVSVAADVREAFYRLQGAEQMLELRRSVLDAAAAGVDASQRLRDAGNITDLNLATEQATLEQARIDLSQAEADVLDDREHLTSLLGLWGNDVGFRIGRHLPDLPATDVPSEGLEAIALRQRLDLLSMQAQTESLAQSLGLAKNFALLPDVQIGVDSEREPDGSWMTGPNLSVPIPIFDAGQAATGKARAELRQSQHAYYAKAVTVRSQVRAAVNRLSMARRRAIQYRDVLLPLRQRIVDQTQLQYNGMLTGVFQLLQAKRDQIETGTQYLSTLRDYWIARVDLERAIGGNFPGAMPVTQPATRPSDEVAQPAEHKHH